MRTKWFQRLESQYATSRPGGTLVILYELRRHIKEVGISTSAARTYEDKEKVHAFLENVNRIVAKCERMLDPAALQDVELCVKYKAEENNLKQLLCYKARQRLLGDQEALTKTIKICAYCGRENADNASRCPQCGQSYELEPFAKPPVRPILSPFFAGLIAILIVLFLIVAFARGSERYNSDARATLLFSGGAALILALAKYATSNRAKSIAALADENESHQNVRQELALMMDRERVRYLEEQFGSGDFDYYKDQFFKRAALMSKLMGEDYSGSAKQFVRLSCEGDHLRQRTPERNSPVLIFGNKAPAQGWFFSGLDGFVGSGSGLRPNTLDAPTQRKQYIIALIDHGYTLCFRTSERITIFTRLKLRIAPEGVESLKELMGMTPETMVDPNGCVEPAATVFRASGI